MGINLHIWLFEKKLYLCKIFINLKVFICMKKKIITEAEMTELLESKVNMGNYCVDLQIARKIIMDAVLPLCK